MNRLIGIAILVSLAQAACAASAGSTTEPTQPPTTAPPTVAPTENATAIVEGPPASPDGNPADASPQEQPEDLSQPPPIRLIVDGAPVDGQQGSYCWTDPAEGVGLCVDMLPPAFDSAISLPADQPIRLHLGNPIADTVFLTLSQEAGAEAIASETLPGEETVEWSPQIDAGTYVLIVFGQWEQYGDATYLFSVSLE